MALVRYVRGDTGKKIGCVVALSKDQIGWSLCNDDDRFDKNIAKSIAMLRAESGKNYIQILHEKVSTASMKRYGTTSEVDKYNSMPKLYGFLYPELIMIRDRAEDYFKE
jgi:hypothetical protein